MTEYKTSDHFTVKKLAAFTLMPIITILLCSFYSIVDGFFVSHFCHETAFAGMNLAAPFALIFASFGYMIGEGGCALISKMLGEKCEEEANKLFSFLVAFSIVLGIALAAIGFIILNPFLYFQGAEGELFNQARIYGLILIIGFPACLLQFSFQQYFVAADKPELGILFALSAGFLNIALDAVFICGFSMGVAGAAIGTVIGQAAGALIPVIYILRHSEFKLRFVGFECKKEWNNLLKVCLNGSSEMVSNIAAQVVCILYNFVLLRLAGENGVSAYGVILYVSMAFSCVFMGYDMGVIPVIAYNFGAQNHEELKNVRLVSHKLIMAYSVIMAALCFILAEPVSRMFVGYNEEILSMSVTGLRIFAAGYIVIGQNFFGSALFTGLNNGGVSAFLSAIRTFLLPIMFLFAFSYVWGLAGVWYSLPAAEATAFLVSVITILKYRKKYKM